MTDLETICKFLHTELAIGDFTDASLNGLQIEGTARISSVATAVDAAEATVERAVAEGAQLLLVHHGLFWNEARPITGPLRRTVLRALLAELNLFAVHLPLDAHHEWGNNFQLGRLLGLTRLESCFPYHGKLIGCRGINSAKHKFTDLRDRLATLPGADLDMLTLPFGPAVPERVGIVSGSGADALLRWSEDGIDTFVMGEPRQFAYHYAKENKLNAIFAGHYATETIGIRALGAALADKFGVKTTFIDWPTGI